jgi:hypothetical protein
MKILLELKININKKFKSFIVKLILLNLILLILETLYNILLIYGNFIIISFTRSVC